MQMRPCTRASRTWACPLRALGRIAGATTAAGAAAGPAVRASAAAAVIVAAADVFTAASPPLCSGVFSTMHA
eukprot:133249-Chlamydomonas_euryale.AAC.2